MPWKLTVRVGPKVERSRYEDLEQTLEAVEARGRELERDAGRETFDLKVRQFEPAQQVVARLELAGPERLVASVRAGVDIRGDGSTEAYVGRIRRAVVEPHDGESTYSALRRTLIKD